MKLTDEQKDRILGEIYNVLVAGFYRGSIADGEVGDRVRNEYLKQQDYLMERVVEIVEGETEEPKPFLGMPMTKEGHEIMREMLEEENLTFEEQVRQNRSLGCGDYQRASMYKKPRRIEPFDNDIEGLGRIQPSAREVWKKVEEIIEAINERGK